MDQNIKIATGCSKQTPHNVLCSVSSNSVTRSLMLNWPLAQFKTKIDISIKRTKLILSFIRKPRYSSPKFSFKCEIDEKVIFYTHIRHAAPHCRISVRTILWCNFSFKIKMGGRAIYFFVWFGLVE